MKTAVLRSTLAKNLHLNTSTSKIQIYTAKTVLAFMTKQKVDN